MDKQTKSAAITRHDGAAYRHEARVAAADGGRRGGEAGCVFENACRAEGSC